MRLGLMLALLVAVQTSAQPIDPCKSLYAQYYPQCKATTAPAFEFANASGAGMGTVCACTTPTGSKGEAMTFTRASSGTCLKSANRISGVANGDLVTCTSNQARVQVGSGAPLGLLKEESRTNTFLWSDAFDNVAWTKLSSGDASAPPVVTADQAAAPSGATTADRVDFGSCTTGRSVLYQIASFSGQGVASVYARAVGTSCSIAVCGNGCSRQTVTSGSWTRIVSPAGAFTNGGTTPFVGNACSDEGAAAAACSVYLASDQVEAGLSATSYVATTTAAVARAEDFATFPLPAGVSATGCVGATLSEATAGAQVFIATSTIPTTFGIYEDTPASTLYMYDGVNNPSGTVAIASPLRLFATWSGSTMNGFSSTGAAFSGTYNGSMYSGSQPLILGGRGAGLSGQVNTTISRFTLNNKTTGCN